MPDFQRRRRHIHPSDAEFAKLIDDCVDAGAESGRRAACSVRIVGNIAIVGELPQTGGEAKIFLTLKRVAAEAPFQAL